MGVGVVRVVANRGFVMFQEGMKYDFIVATTKLITGSSFLKSLVDDPSAP